jgi:hypothetical protein
MKSLRRIEPVDARRREPVPTWRRSASATAEAAMPVSGAISFDPADGDQARAAAKEIVAELRAYERDLPR